MADELLSRQANYLSRQTNCRHGRR